MSAVTILDVGMLRRLVEGDLRSDGVTDFQRERLERMVTAGLVEKVQRRRPNAPPFHYVITADGLEATR